MLRLIRIQLSTRYTHSTPLDLRLRRPYPSLSRRVFTRSAWLSIRRGTDMWEAADRLLFLTVQERRCTTFRKNPSLENCSWLVIPFMQIVVRMQKKKKKDSNVYFIR